MTGHSESLQDLAAALAKAQATFPTIAGDGQAQAGGSRKYKYATLAHTIESVRPILAENGLCVAQTCEPGDAGTMRLTTTLLHTSGQYVAGTAVMPLPNNTPQGYGSAMTYARRYQLAAILGIATEDDDDGHEGSQKSAPRARTGPPAATTPPQAPQGGYGSMTPASATEVARRWFFAKVREDCGLDAKAAYALLGVQSLSEEMPDKSFDEILGFLKLEQTRQRLEAGR